MENMIRGIFIDQDRPGDTANNAADIFNVVGLFSLLALQVKPIHENWNRNILTIAPLQDRVPCLRFIVFQQ